MGCRELVLTQSSWKERRAAHTEVRVEAHSEFRGAFHSCRGRWEVPGVVRIGLVPIRGRSFMEAGRICDQWVEMLVSGRALHLPDTYSSAR